MIVVHKDTDITEYVSSMSWGGSKSEVARKLELHIVNAPLDKNITPLTINLADPVYLFEDDGKTELFRGFVVEREASSTTGTVTYTCYDLLFYTIKSNATYNFSSKTAEAITQMVCDDMEIPVGSLAQTGLTQKLIVQNVSIYEIIMRAYTQAYQQNGVSYRVVAKKGYLNVEEMGTEASGSDVFTGNYVWQNYTYNGFFFAILGGGWGSGSDCGFALGGTYASGSRDRYVGGRLLYVPQTKVA